MLFGMPFIESDVLTILFPKLSNAADNLLSYLCIGMMGIILLAAFGLQILLSKARTGAIIRGDGLSLALVPLLFWITHDSLGIKSAAFASVFGKVLFGMFCVNAGRKFLSAIPWEAFFKPMLAGAGMGVILELAQIQGLAMNLLVGGAAYTLGLIASNFHEFRELMQHPSVIRYFKIFRFHR
jgi:hypothetical protein